MGEEERKVVERVEEARTESEKESVSFFFRF